MSFFNSNKVPDSEITRTMKESWAKYEASQIPRGYLGFSSIGSPCELQSWFSWRQTSGYFTDGRVLMLFELGRKVEEIICKAMRLSGYVLKGAFPDKQFSFSDLGGFFSGHPDGIIDDTDGNMILEVKSANSNKFKKFEEEGVKSVYPAYHVQMQLYMRYSGFMRALFIVMKKDDSSLYTEIVPYDQETALAAIAKATRIIQTHDADGRIRIPERGFDDPKCKDCQYCRYQIPCREPQESLQQILSCRSCAYLNIGGDYKPHCGHREHRFPLTDIGRGCKQWSWVCRTPFTIEEEK